MKADEPWPPFRVLCVDDNRDCADSAALLLQVMGFDARACYDGASALVFNESFRPGVCFIDLNMPGMDGDELAVRLRSGAGWRPILIVAVTAMCDVRSRERTEMAEFNLYLVKPVDAQKLMQVLDSLFKAAEAKHTSHVGHGVENTG